MGVLPFVVWMPGNSWSRPFGFLTRSEPRSRAN
jgi:hypothetical protein